MYIMWRQWKTLATKDRAGAPGVKYKLTHTIHTYSTIDIVMVCLWNYQFSILTVKFVLQANFREKMIPTWNYLNFHAF